MLAAVIMSGMAGAQTAPPAPTQQQRDARLAEALKSYHGPDYERAEVMILVRDGVTLHTIILRPVGSAKSTLAIKLKSRSFG